MNLLAGSWHCESYEASDMGKAGWMGGKGSRGWRN